MARFVRALARAARSTPWIVRTGSRTLAAFPTLKLRLRQLVMAWEEPPTGNLNDAQTRVLLDLREATRHGEAGRR